MKITSLVIISILALCAFLTSLFTTSTGTGLAPDSYIYLASARSLLKGDGISIPNGPEGSIQTAHFPPLYAGMLALSSLTVFDPLDTARWLNAIFFGANLFLVGYTILKLTNGSLLAVFLGSIIILSSDGLILIHAYVWSEPTFFFFSILGLLLLSTYLVDLRLGGLVGSALAVGFAFLTRYAGITLVVTGVISLLWFIDLNPQERLKRASLFLVISTAPVGLWMLYSLLVTGSLTDRMVAFHPIDLRGLSLGVTTVLSWFFPVEATGAIKTALYLTIAITGLALLIAFLVRSVRKNPIRRDAQPRSLPVQPFALYTLIYLGFLILSISFFDAQTSLDTRILSPIFITCLILIITSLAHRLSQAQAGIRWLALIFVVALVGAYLYSGIGMARSLNAGEQKGYSSGFWATSKLLRQVRDLPSSIPIYSNGHDVIYLLTGKPAISIPKEISPNSRRVNSRFEDEVREMGDGLREKGGVLVIIYELVERRRYLPTEEELKTLLPLERITRWSKEGVLYRIAR